MSSRKPPRRVLLQCATKIFTTVFDAYHNRKNTLNRLDKEIYEAASKGIARELMPRAEAEQAISEFEVELAKKKEIAANARDARSKQGGNNDVPGTGTTEGANTGGNAA